MINSAKQKKTTFRLPTFSSARDIKETKPALFCAFCLLRLFEEASGSFHCLQTRAQREREKKVTEMADVEWNNQGSKRMIEEQAKEELKVPEA